MAEALLGVVFENLFSLVQNEFATFSGIKQKAEKLSSTLDLIKAVVEDAEKKQITDRSVKIWLQQLKDAVYVLDDILDECSIKSHQLGGLSSFKPKNVIFRHGIGKRLKEIAGRLDKIAEEKNKFLLSEGAWERPSEVAEWRETSSIIAQPRVYGRDEDKEKIVEFLLSEARASDFTSVYPIVGLGGMGKTTLAQLVYNDGRVSSHFDKKIWICVSENFAVKRILASIIESITEEKFNILDLDIMGKKVQELLQGKRYLLILDDVWKRNQEFEFGLSQEKWNELKSVLTCGSKGASILVSTRDKDVAAIMGTCQAHYLSGLSEDDCWLLFKQYAFGLDKEERPELVAIGKEIVKKCGGSPLAAQALGGLLRSKSEKKEWLEVKDSKLWSLQDENRILPALRLSYFHLTPTFKQCFAFCAIFPKDKEIMKEDLIHLWMANGFISATANLDVEDVGNMIWNELCQKSFFQDIKTYLNGDICFKMHDLVHDLAQSIMGQECMILENDANMTDLSRSTHHIGFGCGDGVFSFNKGAFKKGESLRTLYQLEIYCTRISGCFPTSRSLRVLRTSSFKLSSLRNLIHLRFLELHDLKVETLPSSIYRLRKLEILKLENLDELKCLPKHLTCLQNLRHIKITRCKNCRQLPPLGKLPSLRKLEIWPMDNVQYLDDDDSYDGVEVRPFPSLEKLIVVGFPKLERLLKVERGDMFLRLSDLNISDCPKLRLPCLPSVRSLRIYGCNSELLRSISSLIGLTSLSLWEGGDLTLLPKGMMTNLTCLKTLIIYDFQKLRELPYELTKLNALEFLLISHCGQLESFPEHMEGLRTLRILKIICCGGLRSLPEGVRHLTSLELLTIEFCSALQKRCKEETGEDWHKIAHIPNVTLFPEYDEESEEDDEESESS